MTEPVRHTPSEKQPLVSVRGHKGFTTPNSKVVGRDSFNDMRGGANDAPRDLDLPYWAGVVPVRSVRDTPVPHPALPPEQPLPAYLRDAH